MLNERSLTSIEEGIYILNKYSGCFSVATISHLRGKINLKKLQQSIDIIQDKYDILRCNIIKQDSNLKFKLKELETVKVILEIIDNCHNKSWEDIVIENINQPLNLSKNMLRCLLIRPESKDDEAYFITIIFHAIADGLSSVKLHYLIFQNYENIVKNKSIESRNRLDITSIYNQKFNNILGYIRAILSVIELQIRSKFYKPKKLNPDKIIPIKEREGHFLNYCLDEEITKKIIVKSKQENITVNSLLTAAILLAIADEIKIKEQEKFALYCQCYVDLRKRLDPQVSDEYLEILISSLMSFYNLKPQTNLLSLAKEVNNKTKKELEKRDFMYYSLLLKPIVKTSINNTQRFTPSVGVSNLGKINFKRNYGDFTLENICFVPNVSIYNYSLSLSISTFNNKMTINFAFSYPSFSYEKIDKIAQTMIKILTDTIDSSKNK
ncbi:condensation domain-containing protein [Crocosphaera sp.]|uniref:condensation domain-containing protein n=1 Tax=Crocosphaera sp. TaxID=2729996 RepID=UPI0026268AA3|nr:condensation domain-containing protein [Crocosphaera sp.]MDJ0581931.1 condensation domain-containing protein [Crocosphaera sp.]